jgi:hypothetical protein
MDIVNLKWVILNVLARRPARRVTFDEIRSEAASVTAGEDQTEQLQRFYALGDIDIFQSGFVSRDEAGLQITDAGLSLLRSLQTFNGTSLEVPSQVELASFKRLDDLIDKQRRLKIIELELSAAPGGDAHEDANTQVDRSVAIETPDADSKMGGVETPDASHTQISEGTGQGNRNQPFLDGSNREILIGPLDTGPQDASSFLRRSFGSRDQLPSRKSSRLSSLFAFVGAKKSLGLWRSHFVQGLPNEKTAPLAGKVGGAAFALLSVLVVITCVGAAIALGQVKSLKSDIAMLQRELLPLRERVAKLEQAEKLKRELDQRDEPNNQADPEKRRPGGEIRTEQVALTFSREEIQLIREYIKPAPVVGTAVPTINVGDPVTGGMIPLPSSLTDKIPKLVGARFAIRNGAIIIVKRDSRQADAVLPPY